MYWCVVVGVDGGVNDVGFFVILEVVGDWFVVGDVFEL